MSGVHGILLDLCRGGIGLGNWEEKYSWGAGEGERRVTPKLLEGET